jgi:signal transduction histidine kinase
LLDNVRACAADRYEAKGVRLAIVADADLPDVRVDVDRLGQVLTNLVDNALRYSPPDTCVTLSASIEGRDVVLGVADEGEGIAAEHLPRVFERFYRADAARDRAHGGSGIGLAIVKAIVEAHGGRVTAASGGVGRGSQLTLRLPGLPSPGYLPKGI